MEFDMKVKNLTKEERRNYIIGFSIIFISIITGIFVGQNGEWFSPANFSAGYMAGSLITALVLFFIYQIIDFFVSKIRNNE
ncbi:hypothetical protein [Evansella halocellulosilytica]|uniref:hypothetical protein n=1 Tax=Evansella halocellulosilytica TaxID=2011013 RepID=UPI00211CC3B8|nr:hypothetical protein [Evansella halocellulosilytica]